MRNHDAEKEIIINLVDDFFKNKEKSLTWFITPNPLLGRLSPENMIQLGRFEKLLNFIKPALGENKR